MRSDERVGFVSVPPGPSHSRCVLQVHETSLALFMLSIICIVIIVAASLHDIVARTIPNSWALALAVAGVVLAVFGKHLTGSFLSAGGVFILAALCWHRGWMGGGDAKLLGAAALGMPVSSVFAFIAAVAIAGGLLAIVYLVARRVVRAPAPLRPDGLFARALRVERWRIGRGGPLPYACAIAAGTIFVSVSGGTL
jgi:prepilin peptidase CpaA